MHNGLSECIRYSSRIYTLKSAQVEVRAMSYGARLVSIRTADRVGQMILGYDSLQEYLNDTTHVACCNLDISLSISAMMRLVSMNPRSCHHNEN